MGFYYFGILYKNTAPPLVDEAVSVSVVQRHIFPLWAICFGHGKETAKEIAAIKAEELIALTLHCHTPFRCFSQYSVLAR